MKRDLRSKKMPSKPMKESEAESELELDMPMSDEEMGSEEANEEDLLPMDEEAPEDDRFADFSDDDIIEEFKKRGLSLEESSEMISEESAEEELV